MKHASALQIVIIALFAALICVATMLVQIPIPATGGYVNLGDGIILICSFLMNPLHAVVAAALGSGLADMLTGYFSFVPGTIAIKGLVALFAALIFSASNQKNMRTMVVSGFVAEVWMVLGYFIYEAVLLGVGIAAVGGIMGNVVQGIAGIAAACIVAPVLANSDEVRELMNKTKY